MQFAKILYIYTCTSIHCVNPNEKVITVLKLLFWSACVFLITSIFCDNTAPIPVSEASQVTMNPML